MDKSTPLDPAALALLASLSEAGSLSAAARAAGVTQPALTKQLARLERQLGVPLFVRSIRGVVPTEYGQALLPRARIVRAQLLQAAEALAQLRGRREGQVSVALSHLATVLLVPGVLPLFRTRWPGVRLRLVPPSFAQLMTGIQIQCAECHNHPFDRWTMTDYYGFVSFFTGIRRKQGVQYRDFIVYNDRTASPARHLVDQRPVPATVLGGESPVPAESDQLEVLAEWLTSPENPHFARNFANRIWAQFFARGLVEPVDDMRITNPPTNGPLLDALTARGCDWIRSDKMADDTTGRFTPGAGELFVDLEVPR